MTDSVKQGFKLPSEQEAIQDKCFHPSENFGEFPIEDVETSIPARFEKIVRMYPDYLAVKSDSHAVTYAELNAMANRVAHAIVAERGNRPESIGTLLGKGVEQIAAMLGILKAGKFFTLLDPSFPTERLSLVLEDSKATLLLVDQRTLSLVQQDIPARCKLIRIDTLAHSIPDQDPKIPISPHALACIVYTSGSTGRPKAVVRNHRALLHGAMLRIHTDGISNNDRLAHITAGTSNSVTNSFYALLQGTALVTIDLKREGVGCLANRLIDERISICLIASPVFRSLCATLTGGERFPDLRYLRLRSDTVYSSDVALHRKHFPTTCSLATGLSSSETGPLREFRITHDTELSGSEVPVGYALKDKEVLLLDENGKEVGFNEIGEIVVRSEYLSLGYWNDPELTAQKFKPDPQGTGKRLYFTGDLGEMLPDGCLIHKRRKDFRVKIRGYGVDLIEIEKTLRSHGTIKEAVVIAKPGDSGDARLVAYYTSERQPGLSADELRKFLGANLVEYMIPSAFVKLDALPLTSNGKVNRNALPTPRQERPELKEPYQSPRNPTEQALVEIWEGLLDVRPVGVHDNFFDLGGHSLTATRLVSEVVRHFESELPLQQLFECPTVAEIAVVMDQHCGQKSKDVNPVKLPPVSKTPVLSRDSLVPLAYAQQGLWFIDELHPGSITYNLFSAYGLKGNLNIAALEKSFNEIIRRHEILRTVFKSVNSSPVQVILPSLNVEIPIIDLQGIASEEERRTQVRRLGTEEAQRPFDLAHGPLLRVSLLRLTRDEYVLLRAIHHTVFDAWSSGVLHRELAQLYTAFSKGGPSPLADLSIQYASYALWQRQCLETGALQDQLNYWKTQLTNLPPSPLPADKPRPSINKYRGARQYYELSKDLSEGLKALSRRYGVTLFTILLAAFQTLISRHSGQTDVVIGSPVAGRNRSEFDESIGHFLNMMVLRADLSGNPTFAEVTARVWKVCLEALSHQDLPFQKLVEELHPARDLSHDPLIQVAFAFLGTMNISPHLPGMEVNDLEVETGIAKFDLQLEIEDQGGSLGGFVEYNVDLFNADTILRLLEHFRNLLAGIVANPDRRICDFPLLTEPERQKLLVEWNDTAIEYPQDKWIHGLFETQVEKTPDAIAAVFEGQQLSYVELNSRANQLANYLMKLGVGPKVVVGICVEWSLEMIIGLLGILKAGGAYVPLDPSYPPERLEFMLADAQAAVLLTQKGLFEDAGSRTNDSDRRSSILDPRMHRVDLAKDWRLIAEESDANPENITTADNLAYVIYTSGSTGQPKGVQITHKSLLNLVFWHHQAFSVTPFDRATQLVGPGFDAAVWELWPYLTVGASIHIPAEIKRRDAESLRDWLVAQAITISFVPTALAESLMALEWPRGTALRTLLTGGDTLRVYPLETLPFRVFNNYGPTECTVVTTSARVWPNAHPLHFPTIGRPIANTQIYILDAQRNPLPIGVVGEIYIGGEGVARGYLNQPELTAEKFIYHSFNGEPARRLYKTGDLARYLADGNIEFLGRIDTQIKIRGYRIEPGEIETVLGQHRLVQSAVVVVREATPGDKRLVAYVVARPEQSFDAAEIKKHLKQRLPEYMIPSRMVVLDELPLTPNGKIDRRALPAPDQDRPELGNVYQAPRTLIEETLASIWSELLKVDQVGIHDNFFDLGGHSLLATQLISRIRDVFGFEMPLRSLFESPTVAGLADQIDSARGGESRLRALPILPEPIDEEYPLSFSQERFWFLEQLEPNNSAYQVAHGFRLTGPLNVEALEQTLSEIMSRHEVLRTTFHLSDDKLVQRISDPEGLRLPIIDLRQKLSVDLDAEIQGLFENQYRTRFDLSSDLLLRATLLRLSGDEHVLFLNSHHITSDHWSAGLLSREISILYKAFDAGKPSPLPRLSIQYKHYALWQRKIFQGPALERHLEYWKEHLNHAPPSLDLPTDSPRKPLSNRRGGRETLALPKSLSDDLAAFSREAGVTVFMTFLAAFQTLLHRMTGQEDIVIGTPVAGRDRSETEKLIGLFVNTLALRTNLSGNPTFVELLKRVWEVALGAYDHQDLPFEKLVEELQQERDLTRTPIFQVFLNMYNFGETTLGLEGLFVKRLQLMKSSTQFDISLFIREQNDGTHLTLQYDADLFTAATIDRMLRHFQTLLEGIVSHPEQRISDLPLLTEAEKHHLLVEWNETKRDYPKDKCIHELFEEQAKRTPESVAVVFEQQQLSYGELNSRANQLAHYLKQLGVGPEVVVGICAERSLEMITGLLGILKAGGAYVPLDPEYPMERLAFMLEDAKVGVLLTQQKVLEELPPHEARVICLDGDWGEIAQQSEENPSSEMTGEHLAYVIYTSGSTGTPKGAMNTHKGLCNRLYWMQETYHLSQSDRVLQKTPFSFDVSVWEFFWPLITGSRLVIARPGGHRDSGYLIDLVNQQQITTLHFVPSMLRLFLAEERVESCKTLRQVICSGEALPFDLQVRFFERLGAKLHNLYGPTEASIDVTHWECQQRSDRAIVPIGRPIANTQIYLLDKLQNPVPIGVPGELHIGGDGLARGYLNRPELTAEKFIANPFSPDVSSRLYKTGDLARYFPDGNIEFVGRIDDQVKVRGYRVELGEIEAVLGRHPTVREAIVAAREDSQGDQRLVAYLVARPDASKDELRNFLKQKLPEFMLPSVFMFLEALPLTPNGKLDRSALPRPPALRPELDGVFSAPRTPVEERLAAIWAEILNLDKVGIHDNFFELGGHSLLATRVMASIRNALSVELPLRRLFECPTVYGLAKAISAECQTPQTRRFPAIAPASRDGDLPLSFAQQRLWFIDQLEPESSVYNVPGAWRLSGQLDLMALQRSVNEIIRRHEVLRTSFVAIDGQPLQRIRPSVPLTLDLISFVELADSERESAIKQHVREESREPFDLARGSLLRAKLLRLAEDDHVLLLTMHHIVSDGWSVGVLFRELSRLYEAFAGGNASPLEDLPIQYADYAVWQRGWLQGEVLEAQLAYWRTQLDNLTVLQLPSDRQRPAVQRYRGARARVNFDATLTKKLWALSRDENATLYMTLLAAFQVLLSRYSGQEDIAVGSPIAGRSTSEVEGLIGFFANTLVLRGDLSTNPTFREFLQRMRDVALEAYAHQDLPFEKLVEDLRPRRDLNISPLFQVMLVMQNDPREDLDLKGLRVSSVPIDSETAKFDLLLSLRENKFGLRGTLEYDTDLFDSATIDRMLGQFETLLRGIVADPDQRLLQLPLLADNERHQLLVRWNDANQEYPKHLCVHQLFERQAEIRPDGIAIVFEDRHTTYRELEVGSNQLAHYLRKQGVRADSVVGVCLDRSPEMILAILAILKAGGAYLPLDPSYPPERLGLMVEQAGAPIILTQKNLVGRIPTEEGVCHCLDSLAQPLAQEKQERLGSSSSPENAAYVLFTSGSTGVPKAVLMEHRPLVNLLSWQAKIFASPAAARTLQFAPLTFDVSFQEIFSALCSGGTLVMIGEAERRDATALWPLLKEKTVERMFLPFIALQQLAEAAQDDAVAIESLREIITAGEQLQATQPIANLFARLPDCRLYNQYGPTESHVVTSFALGGDPGDWPNLPPIGRPIANSKVYILDRCLQPVPIGVIGEIYIGGDSLARGYLNQPDLSREKFISNPFIKEPGARLYKTGDLARYLADGNIQFAGRIDGQVKVRGFRVEPGEIETLFCRHPDVLECVISVCEDATGGKRLVAYIVTSAGQHLTSGPLRDYLKEKLPEYMLPNVFVFLDSLPLTASGKIDRRALPAPDGSRPELAEAYAAPRNVTEKLLANIWAEVLKLDKLGIHDNFFELGGHSLLATRVASRIREVFRIELPLRALFEKPTLASLSDHVEAIRWVANENQPTSEKNLDQTEEIIL